MKKVKNLRLNEAGDFHSQKCVKKATQLAKFLKNEYNINTYTYSARKDLDFSKSNVIIRSSGHNNGNAGKCEVIFDKKDKKQDYFLCPANCKKCDVCITTKNNIAFLAHGPKFKKKKKLEKQKVKYLRYKDLEVKLGNTKLPSSTMIFNITTAENCPAHNKSMCFWHDICYAKRDEHRYPLVKEYHKRQERYWKTHSTKEIISDFKNLLSIVKVD